jgi:hypothetical protein
MAFGDLIPTNANMGAGTPTGAGLMVVSTRTTWPKRMPPPPAPPLTDYERTVIENWSKRASSGNINDLCAKRARNGRPVARLLEKRKDGNALVGVIEITDPDGEQVYGRASAGNSNTSIQSGRRDFRIDNASGNSLQVRLSDGYDTVEQTFDF